MPHLLFKKLENNKTDNEAYTALLPLLPLVMQQEVLKFNNPARRQTSFWGKWLIRAYLLAEGFPLEWLEYWERDRYEKPHCGDFFQFNISHSGDWVVVVADIKMELGVDIQQVKTPKGIEAFAHLLHPAEWNWIEQHPQKSLALAEVWAKKEAFLKCLGIGIFNNVFEINILNKEIEFNTDIFYFKKIEIADNYVCYCCTKTKDYELNIKTYE